jgi:hypothetical protein
MLVNRGGGAAPNCPELLRVKGVTLPATVRASCFITANGCTALGYVSPIVLEQRFVPNSVST